MVQTKNLITGGAGFLGSNLIEKLIKKKEYVICLDNCFTGKKSNIKIVAIDIDKIELNESIVKTNKKINLDLKLLFNEIRKIKTML